MSIDRDSGSDSENIKKYIFALLDNEEISRQIAHHRLEKAQAPSYGECKIPWSRACQRILEDKKIRLFSHQARAMDYIRSGQSIMVATPTASGKSLIYNLPFHESFLRDPECRALYLFPLKALAQDQLGAFQKLSLSWPRDARPSAALYDGDTTDWQRRKIRKAPPSALMTNPEMLHLSLLPYHESWTAFLANLSYIIVDEAHTYRGIFGSHMAQLFRRLNRICSNYGADPVYIFCSATLGNPLELAQALCGKDDIKLIDKSGAPRPPRHFIFMDPEKSSSTCAIDLLKRALGIDLRSIVYCQSRRMTELLSLWAASDAVEWKSRISSYRAGFLPEERRDIEARMANGELRAVVSTSALELGIDIGGLDLCILAGYPGTIMQTLQRGGRVGRAGRESAVIVIAGDDALDQYFIRNPHDFFQRSPEKAVINPYNPHILEKHLECAAVELRLRKDEEWLKKAEIRDAVEKLANRGLLARSSKGDEWLATRKRPHGRIDLRGCGNSYSIEDQEGRIIGAIDGYRVWKESHPGAVYIHHGRNYLIDAVEDGRMRIRAREQSVNWHTRARFHKTTEIMAIYERKDLERCAVLRCRLKITERVTAYEKRSNSGNRLLTISALEAPAHVFETEGICFIFPDEIRRKMEDNFLHFMSSIHAMEHAIIGLLPLELIADRNDFGGISVPLHPQLGLAAVFIYDGIPGGAGLSFAAFNESRHILEATYKAIADCPCEDGCPSCIQSPKCGAGNRPLSKAGAKFMLNELLSPGTEGSEICSSLQIGQDEADVQKVQEKKDLKMSTLPESLPHYVVFDVETRRSAQEVGGWDRADQMGVSVAVLYDSAEDKAFCYEQEELGSMFARMAAAELIVGFNNISFDNQVLLPFWIKWREKTGESRPDLYKLASLDMLRFTRKKIGYPVSLDNFAASTLGTTKSANGLKALAWWKEGKVDKIAAYCRQDVEITRQLYLYGLVHGCLYFRNKAGMTTRMEVDFSRANSGGDI